MGRRREIAEVRSTLSGSRLVTLTGVGGVGKSRLALRVARALRRAFDDDVWLVELARLRAPSLLAPTVVAALGLRDDSAREPEAALLEYLSDKRLLLVLDNCEHLVEECARLVSLLLPAAPGLQILATSREALGVSGEHVWPVPPLSLPNLETDNEPHTLTTLQYEALALFEQRAAAVLPGFTVNADNRVTVAKLCQRLEGLPLAIELAAVRMRALSVDQILPRLDDRFRLLTGGSRTGLPHHQTLRATFDWSFDLCTPHQQALWRRLSVFAGGFDLEAAEAVCSDEALPPQEVLTTVTGLVDQSVLIREETDSGDRYRLLETIRQYGQQRLRESGNESRFHLKHRDYYLQLAEDADADWFGPRQFDWLAHLRTDHPNLQAALDFSLSEPGQSRHALRIGGALWFYWIACGFLTEGRHWLQRALTMNQEPCLERVKALWIDGYIATRQGNGTDALVELDEGRRLAEELGDEAARMRAVQMTGLAELIYRDHSRGRELLEEALTYHRAVGEPDTALAITLFYLALAACVQGDLERSVALCEECREMCESRGERWSLSRALWILSLARWARGELRQSYASVQSSLRIERVLKDPISIALCLEVLAWIAAAEGKSPRAAKLFGASRKLFEPLGEFLFGFPYYLSWHDQAEDRARSTLGQQAFETAYQAGRELTLDAAAAYGLGERTRVHAEPTGTSDFPLTRREKEIAEWVAKGLSNKEIAAQLVIAKRTVDAHVEHILTKLGFHSRTQVAAWIAEQTTSDHTAG